MEYPKVDPDICTGCGICVELCPMDTIVMENGVAMINEENCSNCRFCVSTCSLSAIG